MGICCSFAFWGALVIVRVSNRVIGCLNFWLFYRYLNFPRGAWWSVFDNRCFHFSGGTWRPIFSHRSSNRISGGFLRPKCISGHRRCLRSHGRNNRSYTLRTETRWICLLIFLGRSGIFFNFILNEIFNWELFYGSLFFGRSSPSLGRRR